MQSGEYQFRDVPCEFGRIIETIYPELVDVPKLSAVIADYYALWDETTPTAVLGSVANLREISDSAIDVSIALFSRFVQRPNFVAAAWYTGENVYARELWINLLAGVPGSKRIIFRDRDVAVAYVAAQLEARVLQLDLIA